MAGLWCTALGYGNAELVEAAREQLARLPFAHLFGAKSHDQAVELAEKLKAIAPAPTSKVFFTASGSEANDTQVKLAWYYNNARGLPARRRSSRASAPITASPRRLEPHRASQQSCRFRPSARPLLLYRLPASLSLRGAGRERGRTSPRRLAANLDALDPARGARYHRRLHRRAGDGGGRRDRAARGLFRPPCRRCSPLRHPFHRR